MDTVTLLQLRNRVRQRADIENFTDRFPDAELTSYINRSARRLRNKLTSAYGAHYYESSNTFSTTANTAAYTLPTDFYQLISVEATISSQLVPLKRYNVNERPWLRNVGAWGLGPTVPLYRLRGNTLDLSPAPDSVYSVTVYYVPTFTDLSADGDTLDSVSGWDEWVVVDCAIKCFLKDDRDPGALLDERAGLEAEIQSLASARDEGSPERVTDRSGSAWGDLTELF